MKAAQNSALLAFAKRAKQQRLAEEAAEADGDGALGNAVDGADEDGPPWKMAKKNAAQARFEYTGHEPPRRASPMYSPRLGADDLE
jgi:hypothetical protein